MTLLSITLLSPSSWTVIGAPLGNHLWQSTVFVGIAWLLTLILRKNRAQSRYALWLIGSAKFLIPFSLLIGVGSHLPWSRTPVVRQPAVFLAMETLGEPFAPVGPVHVAPLPSPGALQVAIRILPALLLVVWSVGCLAVILAWYLRWRGLHSARRAALPLQPGPELEALHRAQRIARFHGQIELLLSQSALEPGIFGIFRPALLLPAGISEKLTEAQLESVLAHELCHVRRRDNLAAAFHMLVEALFWFHPLVWWMGTRLVDERERACDEEVLQLGADPHVYAESILKVCKFYLEPPLFCAAGVTGSNLKKRIEAIMSNHVVPNLEWSKKLLLSAMGVAAVGGPVLLGLLHASQSSAQAQAQNALAATHAFENISIKTNTTGEPMPGFTVEGRPMRAVQFKPDRFMATNFTLRGLIALVYRVQESQISGGYGWVSEQKYDVEAKLGSSAAAALATLNNDQRSIEKTRMLQSLLADRFKLAFHRETQEVPGFALIVAKSGSRLQQAKPGDTYLNGLKDLHGRPVGGGVLEAPEGKLVGQGVPINDLVKWMATITGANVIDKTGLSGNFDFTLHLQWTEEDPSGTVSRQSIDSLLKALPQQLGLELRAQTVPVEMLVIDHAERVTGNEQADASR